MASQGKRARRKARRRHRVRLRNQDSRFEVASIRVDKAGDITKRVRYVQTPGALYADNMTLHLLIRDAYGVSGFQIKGGPGWVRSEEFEIEAKVGKSGADQLQRLSVEERRLQQREMLQTLLADRFKLRVHREVKEGSVYALVVAKNGPKLQAVGPDDLSTGKGKPRISMGGGKLVFRGLPITPLAGFLSQIIGRAVVDKTGLTGRYDFTLRWTPDEFNLRASNGLEGVRQTSDNPSSSESSGPSIFTAIQQQLGLKLKPERGPVEIIVIDHIEQPTAN
jgi:uncharacterized protein (TIGR03435 family)